ncbi:hypothetical protein T484DRAFT_2146615 [Baffinella frigidus]|nr:hypothetical protein T484DRAFT_2146615 [Cryptophyta sp. CCMP2293]
MAKIMGGNHMGDEDEEEEEDDPNGDPKAWMRDPLVYMRRIKLAVTAASPRWKKRLTDEAAEWAHRAYLEQKVKRKPLPETGWKEPEEELTEKPLATTKFLEMKRLRAKYGEGFFEMMVKGVEDQWAEEYRERKFGELKKMSKDSNYRKVWDNFGLPSDVTTDEIRQREVWWGAQFPSEEADEAAFIDQMKGKWNDLLKTFHTMDKDEDGTLDLQEFKQACKVMGLAMSDFQVHRLYTAVVGKGKDVSGIYYDQFLEKFLPPQPDIDSVVLLHNKVPFLSGGPEETTRELIRRSVAKTFSEGQQIYRLGDEGKDFWMILKGSVRLKDINCKELRVLEPGQVFGVDAVIHEDHDAGFMRREAAEAAQEGTKLLNVTRSELAVMYPRHPDLRKRVMQCSWFWQSEGRANNAAGPKYPDSRFFNYASFSENRTGNVISRQIKPAAKLLPEQEIRIMDNSKPENWSALIMESSFNEYGPGVKRVPRARRILHPMGGGIEATTTFDEEKDPLGRSILIREKYSPHPAPH